MNVDDLVAEVQAFCRQNADPQMAQKYTRYFVEGYDPYGVDPKLMEAREKEWLAKYRPALGLAGFLQAGDRLVRSGKYEEANAAFYLVRHCAREFTPQTFDHLATWLDDGIRNWAHCDLFSGDIVSTFLTRQIIPVSALADWRAAQSKWKRRAVPVSLLDLLKGRSAVGDLLDFLAPMMTDGEKVVHQGLGWFLREAWKRDAPAVEAFLLDWKQVCARLIVQYATEKMSAEQKARFKRDPR